ncbi:hypothetical protein ACFLZ5_04815 [Thermodesulfobacteriota bacterium]
MAININQDPPANILGLRRKYIIISLFFLGLVICAIILGVISVFFETGHTDFLENSAFVLFVSSGFAFVYFTEKFLDFRKPGPKRQEKLVTMMYEYEEVSEYCRKVAEQGRYLVVMEYDAIVAHVQKIEGGKPAN